MKNILGLLMLMASLQVFAGIKVNENHEEKTVGIELKKGKATNDDTYPRTLIPITCVYVDGTVQLTMLENLGEMEFFVTNQATGEQWITSNNWMLETSTASGVYLVEIVFEDGTTYWGTYTLL